MNNQQREQEALNQQTNPELEKLEEELREAIAAESFFEQASGILFAKIANKVINQITKEILSDKFEQSLSGYNNAKAKINAYRDMLKKMQVAASPARREKLEEKISESS